MINNSHCPSWGSILCILVSTMGRTEKMVRALYIVYYRLPAAVIDQSEQDIAYVPTRLTQFFNLDPPSRRADCACSTASLCQRDRLPSTRTPGSDVRVPESTIGSTNFWLHTPISPLLGSLFYPLEERNIQTKARPSFLSFSGFPAKMESRLRRREAKRAVGFLPRYGSYSMDGMGV